MNAELSMVDDSSLFTEIIGHQDQQAQLRSLVLRQAVPHAMLFSGDDSIGKRSSAIAFASYLLSGGLEVDPAQVALIKAGSHPDFHIAFREEGKKEITVDSIRELRSRLHLKPYSGKAIVALINEAHRMNASAYNALLKTLEEPNPNTYLLLTSESLHALPPTILSRCQVLHFAPLSTENSLRLLGRLVPELAEDSSLMATAREFCKDSLAALELDGFRDPKRIGIPPSTELTKHIRASLTKFASIHDQVQQLLGSRDSAKALSLASEIAAEKTLDHVVWRAIRSCLRKRLLTNPTNQAATALLESLSSEQRMVQRNLNSTLVTSDVLLHLSRL